MRRLNQQHCPKSGFANPSGILQHSLEHWLKLTGRGADNLEDLRSRGFALARFGELAGQLLDICFLAGSEGTTTAYGFWRIAALQRLTALRFRCFAPALSGRLIASPEAQDGHRIGLRTRERIKLLLRAAQCPLWVKSGHVQCTSRCPLSANSGHRLIRLLHQRG